MGRIPKEKIYSEKQLRRRSGFFKWIASHTKIAGRVLKKTDGTELFLDTSEGRVRVLAYGLERPERLPLFVDIHGGGFIFGHAEMDDPYMKRVADRANVKIINVDYSLSPEAPFPKALNECCEVIRYAQTHADELGIDPERIAVGGHSAGGNFGAAICLKDAERKELGVKCLVLDYPGLDLYTDPYLKPRLKGALLPGLCRIFNASYCIDKEKRKNPLVSPFFASDAKLVTFPPTLIVTAGHDSLRAEAEEFGERLARLGVDVTCRCFEGSFHGFTMGDKPDALEGWRMMTGFLKSNLW